MEIEIEIVMDKGRRKKHKVFSQVNFESQVTQQNSKTQIFSRERACHPQRNGINSGSTFPKHS